MRKINWHLLILPILLIFSNEVKAQCPQSNATDGTPTSGSILSQSFQVSCDGNITDVTVDIGAIAGDDAAITGAIVSIRTGNDPTGAIVGSSLTGVTLTASSTNTFDFSAANVAVTNGSTYTIVIDDNSDADDFEVEVDAADPLANGSFWSDASTEVAGSDLDFSVIVNDAPIITVPAAQTTDETTNISFTGGTLISIADADVDNQSVTVSVVYNGEFRTATATGTLTATGSGGASVGGSGTDNLTISGTLTDVNNTLDGMAYVPGSVSGVHQITVSTDDGNGGSDSQTIDVGVTGTYTLTVTTDDGGDPEEGSLRAAITDANTVIGADVIDASGLGASQTISLVADLPTITDDLTISGPSVVSDLTIDGSDTHALFENLTDDDLTITDLTLANGLANTNGGAIYHNSSGTLTIERVHFFSNSTSGGDGGAISLVGNGSIIQSLFESNSSSASGGAILFSTGTLSISNTTFSSNTSTTVGGAIRIPSGAANLDHVTITGNSGTTGDGIESGGTTTLNYSVIYGNGTEDVNVTGGTFNAELTANIIGTSTGTILNNTNVSSANPGLGTLADNGGETQTIDIGPNARHDAVGSIEADDQTGTATRPAGAGGNDLGAYEASNAAPTGTDFTVAAGVDDVGVITTADLGYADGDSDPLVSVDITSLPAGGVTLFLDLNDDGINDGGGESISAGDDILLADLNLDRLKYEAASTTGNTTFTFTVFDGEDLDAGANTGTLYSVENALIFDGDDNITVADDPTISPTGNITLEAWINLTSVGAFHTIIGKYDGTEGGYLLRVNNSNFVEFHTMDDNTTSSVATGSTALSASTWYHVAGVFDGSELRVYVNGVLDGALTDTRNPKDGSSALIIGEAFGGILDFNGSLDEVRIWNTDRTAAQIRANAASRITNPTGEANLVFYLDMNVGLPAGDNSGLSTTGDLSSSGLTGSINGFTLTGSASNFIASTAFSSAAATTPNITVLEGSTTYPSAGTAYDFGAQPTATNTDVVFTILNQGLADLDLNGAPSLGPGDYSLQSPYSPTVTLNPGQSQSLTVRFTPTSSGTIVDQVSIPSTDAGSPYLLNLTGEGQIVPTYTATWLDDGDGDIDQLRLDFNTAISVTDNSTGDGFDAFSVSGFTIDNVNGFAVNDDFGVPALTNVTSILLDISGVTGTASPAGATITYNTGSDEDITADAGGLELTAAQAPTSQIDGAAPVLVSSSPADEDSDVSVNANIVLTFSEDIVAGTGNVDIVDVVLTDDRTIAIGSTTILTNQATIDPGADLANFRDYAVQIDATALDDGSGNSYAGIGDNTTLNFTTIGATPTFDITWLDNSGDGNIDQMQVDFSANVDFTDATPGDAFDAFSFSGSISITDVGNFSANAISTYTFNITGATGTASPSETVTYNRGSDNTIVADIGGQEIADLDNPGTVTDGAAPIFENATFYDTDGNGSVDEILLEFSEDIDETTVDDGDFTIGGAAEVFSFVAGTSSNNGVDTDENDVYVTLSVNLNTTDDRPIVYTQDDVGGTDVADAAGNQALDNGDLTEIDAAAPVLTELRIEDTNDDGTIDQMTYVFSEIVFDIAGGVTDGDIGTLRMPDNSTFDGGGGNALGDANVSLTNDGTYGLLVMDVAAAGYTTVGTAAGSANVEGTPSANFDDDQGQVATENVTIVDAAAPVITSVTITGNSYVDVDFSEGVYSTVGPDAALGTGNFNLSFFDGSLGGLTVDDVNTTGAAVAGESSLLGTGGQSTLRVFFSFTGSPDGTETLEVDLSGSVLDIESNAALASQPSPANQDDMTAAVAPQIVSVEWLDQDVDGQIDAASIRFDIDWDIDEGNTSNNTGDNTNGLRCFILRNGATVITQDNVDYDNTNNGFNDQSDPFILTFANDQQLGTSIDNFTLEYQQGSGDRIESQASQDEIAPINFVSPYLDGAAPFFGNFTVTVLDNDTDGNVDRIQVNALDNIDDSAIDPSEFSYNGSAATGVVNIDNTDQSFTLTVNGSGTEVEGDFIYTPGVSLLDTAANASSGGTEAQVDINDGAGPVVINAITDDTNSNGFIDEITLTFSEDLAVINGDELSFSVNEGGDSYTSVSATQGPANTVTLVLTEGAYTGNIPAWPAAVQGMDTYITPDITVSGGYADDAAAISNPGHTFTGTSDGAAPYIRVSDQMSNNLFPDFSGEIDDPNASLIISVDGKTRSSNPPVANNGDGTWSYTSADDGTPIELQSGLGDYEVTVIGIDASGNNRTDVTSDEYELTGGITITPANPGAVCISDGFTALGTITMTESGNGDFGAGTNETILLTLPEGFEFQTNGTANPVITGTQPDISTISGSFVGTATLKLTLTVTGSTGGDQVIINNLQIKAVQGGVTGNLERTGGTASVLTSDTNYASLSSNTQPTAIASLDETTTTTSDITEYAVIVGNSFTLDASDQSPSTVNWYENVIDGTPEYVGLSANQAQLNSSEGLFTYFVVNTDGTCESDPLSFNLLNYTYSDNGTNDFSSRLFRSTDDPDTMVFSKPANHTVTVSGTGIVANISESTTLKAVFDPGSVAEGTYAITYEVTNSLGETVSVVGSFTVEALSDLISEFRENGTPDAAPGEVFCEDDVLSFDADLAEVVALSANSYFFRFSYFKTGGPGPGTLSPVAFNPVGLSSYPIDPNQNNGTASPQPWIIATHNPNTDWDIDLSTLIPGASYDIYLEYNRMGDGARGFRRVFSFTVQKLPSVSVVNFGDQCENDDSTYQLEAVVEGSTVNMTNGFELEYFNTALAIPAWQSEATYPDENFNPSDLQISEGGSGPGQYRVIYTSEPQGDGGCINSATYAFTLFPTPNEPFLNASHNISWKGAPWVDGGDVVNTFDSYVMEYCSPSDINFIVGENSGIQYNWYASDQMTLLQGNQWFISAAAAFDDPATTGTTEVPTAGTTTEIYFATVSNGCESALKKITIYIYEDTELPEPDGTYLSTNGTQINTSRYVFEYCDTYDPIVLTGPDDTNSNPTSRNPSARYFLYDVNQVRRDTINTSTLSAALLSLPTGTQDTTIYISQLWNDQTPDGVATAALPFEGCESGMVQFDIKVTETPADATVADFDAASLSFHVAEGENLGDISHTSGLVEKYRWYENAAPSSPIGSDILSGEDMLETTLITETTYDPSVVTVANENDTSIFYVTRISGENSETGYAGCESTGPTAVELIVHAIQLAPEIASDNTNSSIDTTPFIDLNSDGDGGNDDNSVDFYFSVCNDRLESDIEFVATETNYAGSSREFRWYQSDAGGVRGALRPTDGSGRASFSELGLSGLNPPSTIQRYFEVIQVTDNDVFAGTESESTFIRVDISPQDALTFENTNGDPINDDYCRDDDPQANGGDLLVDLQAGGASAGGTNVSYELDSYLQSTYDVNGLPEIDGSLTSGNPTLDLDALHDAVPGALAVGGEPTVHVLRMTYLDPSTLCEGSITKTITINPDPHISFEVAGVDINDADFTSGFNNFCYDQGNVSLRGVQYIYDNTGITDTINLTTGQFSSDLTTSLGSNIGEGIFNPTAEHNAAYGETGQGAKYLNRTVNGSLVTFTYTDGNGCQVSVSENLFVEPEPEAFDVERVNGLDGSDLAAARTSNIIRIEDFCNDGSDAQVSVFLVDPVGGEDDLLTDYTNYGFEWTINGDPVPDDGFGNPVLQFGTNTLTFTPTSSSVNIRVDVTDPNLCTETFTEVHQLQSLPDLDFPEIFDFEEFCADDADVALTLDDYVGGQAAASVSGVLSWEVLSFNTDRTDTVNNPVGAGWSTATVDQDLVGGTFPTIDLVNWHQDAGGVTYVDGRSVGGNSTVHTIYITYQDQSREYQRNATLCEVTYSETIIINPNPDITILVNDNDINGFQTGQDQFCYDENTIELAGVLAPDSSSLFTSSGVFYIVVGLDDDFSSENDDILIQTNNNTAFINPSKLHNDYWNNVNGTTNEQYPFEPQSSSVIQFEYTDENGCFNFVETTLFVDPVPEEIRVSNGSPQDGEVFFITDICNDDSGQITAAVRFIDPTDPAGVTEEDDYSNYTFNWSLDGQSIATNLSNGELNTNVISVTDKDFVLEVEVTDLNGCSVNFAEFHQKQDLPFLDIDQIFDFQEFCSDDNTVPTLTMTDFIGGATTIDPSNITSWQIVSYQTNRIDTVENPTASAWATDTVAQGSGSVPQISLQAWHEGAGGNVFTGTKSIGGNSTVHSIYVSYTDPLRSYQGINTLCETTYVETIIINPSPDISFTLNGQDMDNIELCYDDAGIQLIGINAVTNAPLGGGVFTIPGVALSTNNGEAVFDASDAHGSDPYAARNSYTIEYTYEDNNLCEHTVSKTFFVNPRPEFVGPTINDQIDGIQVANSCASSAIKVYVEMADDSHLYSFKWFVNGNVQQTLGGAVGGDTLVYQLSQGETTANFSVEATYDPTASGATYATSCVAASLSKSVTVGQEPIPSLTWVGLTAGHPRGTDFTIYEDNPELADADVVLVELVIDGNVENSWNGGANNPLQFPLSFNYNFGISGTYGVDLRITTTAGCDVTISRNVNILPHYEGFGSSNTYEQNFENASSFDLTATNGDGGWHIETRSLDGKSDDLITTWRRAGSAPGSGNNSAAVYTEYNTVPNPETNREISFVYSPSFDVSGFNSPTISIMRYSGFISDRDGVVLQYTTDDGRMWEEVGEYKASLEDDGLASTPGWYSKDGISASPGTQAPAGEVANNDEGIGWAIEKGDTDNNFDWQLGISPLGVNDPAYVRFRFALAGQAGEKDDKEGFGFDDFRIYDRRQIVLLELFSSTLTEESVDFNDTINNDADFSGADLLTINYFTDFANGSAGIDQLNRRNARDPGAKGSFYGIANVPSIAISGNPFLVSDQEEQLSELKARLANAKLSDPAFDIDLVTANVDVDNNLHVKADFTATTKFNPGTKIGLFAAVVEPEAILDKDYGLYSEEETLYNVLRKMLPSASGQFIELQDTLRVDQELQLDSVQWSINNMFNPGSFRVIVYAQNLETREVYQAASATVTGGVEVLSVDELKDVAVYPNPADKEVTLEFGNPLSELTEWIVYDQSGREVLKGEIVKGSRAMTVQTSDLPSGLYFIHLYGEDRRRQSKRVIVLH
ncbi:LamG-like jellyroll fold domain-containing protein [Ekhidna sp.]|uniref:LamG-like jellyroll fold domain-containing protein n=1 Tax=Ekhidna sp. TaxID=2608089 RepID=UPI003CCBC1A2